MAITSDVSAARTYILLVEDDECLREALAEDLRARGFEVEEMDDGATALAHLEGGGHPAVVVTDIVMPGVLGNSVATYVESSERHKDIPVVYITGTPELARGHHRTLVKPFRTAELVQAIADEGVPVE